MFDVLIFFKFKLWIVQTKSDGEMTKIKVVYVNEFYTLLLATFSFEII
jgi:hypothetical protein